MRDSDTTWLLFDFSHPDAVAEWHAIDDRVMGGVSCSSLDHDPAGHAVFNGTVSLERSGGFASAWAERIAQPWGERHEQLQKDRQRLAELRAKAAENLRA